MSDFTIVSRPGQAAPDDGAFKVVSRPAVPPTPAADFKVVSRPQQTDEQPGFFSRLKSNYQGEVQGGLDAMRQGAQRAVAPGASLGERAKGAGGAAMGALRYGFSPVEAVSKTLVADPAESTARALGASPQTAQTVGETADLGAQVFGGGAAKKLAEAGVEAVPKVVQALRSSKTVAAAKDIKDFFAPTYAGGGAKTAEATIRGNVGEEGRNAARVNDALRQFQPAIDKASPQELQELNNYIQTRSQGAARPADPTLAALADSLRDVMKTYEGKLRELPQAAQMNFQEDYLNQLWKRPAAAKAPPPGTMTKQGTTGFTRKKMFPTYEEGIKAGMEPVTLDPIKLTNIYVNNAKRYIASARSFNELREGGYIKYFDSPRDVPEGWAPLEGRWTDKPARDVIAEGTTTHMPPQQAYAPKEMARVYNNFISKGMEGKPLYDLAHDTSRAMVASTLGFSAYHAVAETVHGASQAVGDAIRAAAMGEGKQAAKALGSAFTPGRGGQKALDMYLGRLDSEMTATDRKAVDALTRANFGFQKDEFYRTLKPELERNWKQTLNNVKVSPSLANSWGVVRKGLETMNKPLFDVYIPNLKRAAAMREMTNYIERHPNATAEELTSVGRDIADTIDNRFGLAVQDNVFWNKTLKQVSNLVMLAPEWTKGKIAMASEGVYGLPKWIYDIAKTGQKQEMPLATAQLLGLAVTVGTLNALMTFVHTGKAPESPRDLIAFRTGGETPQGAPERGTIPGEQKDFLGYMSDPVNEFLYKLNPAVTAISENVQNKDFRGDPIADPTASAPERLAQHAGNIAQRFLPGQIEAGNLEAKEGSKLTTAERLLGSRPAGMGVTDPDRLGSIQDAIDRKRQAQAVRHRAKAQNQLDPNAPFNRVRRLMGYDQ